MDKDSQKPISVSFYCQTSVPRESFLFTEIFEILEGWGGHCRPIVAEVQQVEGRLDFIKNPLSLSTEHARGHLAGGRPLDGQGMWTASTKLWVSDDQGLQTHGDF